MAEPIESIDGDDLGSLLERIGDARLVLLGEATHGTSEFYRMRARVTQELIRRKGFSFVAIEGDWPDAARVDRYVRGLDVDGHEETAFHRFPLWMWRNHETLAFVDGFAAALALARGSELVATVPANHTFKLREGMFSFALPFPTPRFAVSLLWHPRLEADPAHRWLRAMVREVCGGSGRILA